MCLKVKYMFKYNAKSDLKDGRLVTPISITDNDTILCLDENGNELELEFDDFDFNKTEEERYIIIDNEIITEPEPEEPVIPEEPSEEIIPDEKPEEIITEPEEDAILPEEPVIDSQTQIPKNGFIEDDSEKATILYFVGREPRTTIKSVNIWKDTI